MLASSNLSNHHGLNDDLKSTVSTSLEMNYINMGFISFYSATYPKWYFKTEVLKEAVIATELTVKSTTKKD